MNWLNLILILAAAYLAVFCEATFGVVRHFLGAQLDLLPGLMVYASLSSGLLGMSVLAVLGGLWYDSLSANPLGVSILPLFLVGLVIERYRGLILREQTFAQCFLGLCASAAVPFMVFLLLQNSERALVFGWGSLWQWIVMAAGGAAFTPVWFHLFDRMTHALSYRPMPDAGYRPDREIKRGRS